MLLKRFYNDALAQASYLLGCTATGEALVVDPLRSISQYLDAAAAEGLRVTHVAETHIHADFVSGSRALAARSGARLHLSAEGGEGWSYGFADRSGAVLLRDGDHFGVGSIRIDVVHTPGHTPEHLSYLVTDTAAANQAMGALTGDFIFVGDVGRPDLLERVANVTGTMEESARALFRSLQRFRTRPDFLQLWPGHGAGSACGKALGAVPQTSLGYEKLFNWAFAVQDEDSFARLVLSGQPDPPKYFARMKQVNRDGPTLLDDREEPEVLDADRLPEVLDRGAVVLDTRGTRAYAAGHVSGTISVPAGRSFLAHAGWLVPFDRDVYLISDAGERRHGSMLARELSLIGLDRVRGIFDVRALERWQEAHGVLSRTQYVSVEELASHLRRAVVTVVDVRTRSEWEAGHLPGVDNIPYGELLDRLDELPKHRPLVLHCQTGSRSAIAASVLEAAGMTNVSSLDGGYERWAAAGMPVEGTEPIVAR